MSGTGLADADLVAAIVKASDHLKGRARRHLAHHDVTVPFSVGIELLFVAKKHKIPFVDLLGAASVHFEVEGIDVLLTAAEALDQREIGAVFDAVHGAQALLAGTHLHTSDQRLLASPFPTRPF